MTWQDLVNGTFELASGLLIWVNVIQIRRDKRLRGVSWVPVVICTTWGFWNLYFYAHLEQWASWAGGISIVTANTVWLYYVWKYRSNI